MIFVGSEANEYFEFSIGNNIAYGFAGNDEFYDAGDGDDWMQGGPGDDLFQSVSGADLMFGGPGNDQFFFEGTSDNLMIRGGRGFDTLFVSRDLFADGEVENLKYAKGGALFQLADGGVLDVSRIDRIVLSD